MRSGIILLMLSFLAAVLWLAFSGSLRFTCSPGAEDLFVMEDDPSHRALAFRGRFPGMEKIRIAIPYGLKHRSFQFRLEDESREALAFQEREDSRRSHRILALPEKLQNSKGMQYMLHMNFDAPVEKECFEKIEITTYYPLGGSEVLRNFRLFKPFPNAEWILILALVAYGVAAALLFERIK